MKSCKTLKGGLQEVADDLGVRPPPVPPPVVPVSVELTALRLDDRSHG